MASTNVRTRERADGWNGNKSSCTDASWIVS